MVTTMLDFIAIQLSSGLFIVSMASGFIIGALMGIIWVLCGDKE